MTTTKLIEKIELGELDERFLDIYVDEKKLSYQKQRYIQAILCYQELFGQGEVSLYSAPGRSEIGGNHTDHQKGEVLAAAVSVDAIAVTSYSEDDVVRIVSGTDSPVIVSLDDLTVNESQQGTTIALAKGVLFAIQQKGYRIGGLKAYITSDVLIGAGLSSSAAFETLIGTILSGMYNDMRITPVEIAMIGQYAENVYFGKPCGLMDQMASSVGNLVHIDFGGDWYPKVNKVEYDFKKSGYSLCITDTKSSHADCTSEYAAIPNEMMQVARIFGKEVLSQVTEKEILDNVCKIRKIAGDRAILRALHFIEENKRVEQEVNALNQNDFETFLHIVKASGDSSFKYLQNVYIHSDISHQNVSVALALSEMALGEQGVSRVHGGGFAGTIQAFVKQEYVEVYRKFMDEILGEGACQVHMIRKYGGMRVL